MSKPKSSSISAQTQSKVCTSATARELVEALRGCSAQYGHDDRWIAHTLGVGDCAGQLAAAVPGLDPDHACALGYLHDIGKGVGPFFDHVINGYRYLRDRGYAEEDCSVCLTHSFITHECEMTSGYRPTDPFLQNYLKTHQYTPYEDLICLCDLYFKDHLVPLETRLTDLILRYGASDCTQRHYQAIYRFKAQLEQQIGRSVEEILGLPVTHF